MSKKKIRYAKLLDTAKSEKEPVVDVEKSTSPKPATTQREDKSITVESKSPRAQYTRSERASIETPDSTVEVVEPDFVATAKEIDRPSLSHQPDQIASSANDLSTEVPSSVRELLKEKQKQTEALQTSPASKGVSDADLVAEEFLGQMICFRLGNEEYGLSIAHVREIHPSAEIIALPNLPRFVAGIMNLRDTVIPVIDLGLRFEFREQVLQGSGTMITVTIKDGEMLGILVDSIVGVVEATKKNVRPLPAMFDARENEYMPGVIMESKKRLITMIDIDKLLVSEEFEELSEIGVQ